MWYKEIRGNEGRRKVYNMLRKMGYPVHIARRLRDWSDNHIELFIRSNPPERFSQIRYQRELPEKLKYGEVYSKGEVV